VLRAGFDSGVDFTIYWKQMKTAFGLGFLLGLGIAYAGIKFFDYANLPFMPRSAEEDLRQVLGGRAPRNPTAAPEGDIKYSGQYMTFMYPARAEKHPLKKIDDSILEMIDLEIDSPRLTITATAIAIKEKTLDEVSGVRMRRSQTDVYRENQTIVGVEKNPVFSRLDGKEKTVFVIFHDRLYTLSVTGNDGNAVAELWAKMLPTFHFL
jgi:hypothetical protein